MTQPPDDGPRAVEWRKIVLVGALCLALVLASGAWAFSVRHDPGTTSLDDWLDADDSARSAIAGLVAGLAFGCIDNVLLVAGISALDTVLVRLPFGEDPTVVAGYGNAISGVVSSLVSTFVGRGVADAMSVDLGRAPLWSTAVGFLVGGLVGVVGPRLLLRGDTRAR